MKRITILFAALLCTAGLFAQSSKLPVVKDIVVIENKLQFVIERDGYERVAYLPKSEFNSLLRGLKFHGKLYPSEL